MRNPYEDATAVGRFFFSDSRFFTTFETETPPKTMAKKYTPSTRNREAFDELTDGETLEEAVNRTAREMAEEIGN